MGDQYPLLYELNARHWLYELSLQAARRLTLSDVPESEFLEWKRLGFTHIWLMGVWGCGPTIEDARDHWARLLPDFREEDVVPSPYAVTAYVVSEHLGGPASLRRFRERLHHHGLKLILDFVPNHTSSIHEWTKHRPELYVRAEDRRPDTFKAGPWWIAHGRDPYFPAWIDTAQLDYRNPETRAAMINELLKISDLCDGVRCDMSMLILSDVFAQTWKNFPVQYAPTEGEFWREALAAVKSRHPQFLLLAEAYWDREQQLLELGFDFAYDKRIYDHLVAHDAKALRQHLRWKPAEFLRRTTHFLENHDEERIANRLEFQEHCAAALLTLALPGMGLLHGGQLTGARLRASVHLRRRATEVADAKLSQFYETLLIALRDSAVGKGQFTFVEGSTDAVFTLRWTTGADGFDLAVVNYDKAASEFEFTLGAGSWKCRDLLRPEMGGHVAEKARLILGPFATKLLRFEKTG